MNQSLIILDRDGVINFDSPDYIKSPEELIFIPGSLEAIARLNQRAYTVVVATNQSGIGRGLYDVAMLGRIHAKLLQALKKEGGHIHEIFFCPHRPEDLCHCRKPRLGMFEKIRAKYATDLLHTYFIGDSYSDIEAAFALPCKPLLVLTSKGEQTLQQHPELKTIPHFPNLAKAVDFILDT